MQEAVSGGESRTAVSLLQVHDEVKGWDDGIISTINKAVGGGVKAILKQTDKDATTLRETLAQYTGSSANERGEVRKGMRDLSQRMGDVTDQLRALEAPTTKVSSSMTKQTAELASLQKSSSYLESKVKGIKQLQEAQASDLKLLQGDLLSLNSRAKDILAIVGSTSKQGDTAIAQPPELIQSIEQKLAKMDEIIPALQVAAAGLSNDAGARHDPASSLQRGNYDGQQQLAISMRPNQSSAMQDVPDPEGMPTQAAFQSQLDDLGSNLKRLLQKYFATTGANIGNALQMIDAQGSTTHQMLQCLSTMERLLQGLQRPGPSQLPATSAAVSQAAPGSPAAAQQMVALGQQADPGALGEVNEQLRSIQEHLGMRMDEEDGQAAGNWLAQLQDLPRAATLIVRSLDRCLEVQVWHCLPASPLSAALYRFNFKASCCHSPFSPSVLGVGTSSAPTMGGSSCHIVMWFQASYLAACPGAHLDVAHEMT